MTAARKACTRFGRLRAARPRAGWWTALVVMALTTPGLAQRSSGSSDRVPDRPAHGTSIDADRPPTAPGDASSATLPPLARARVSAAIGEDDTTYHVVTQAHGLRMANAGHDVSAEFTSSGVEFHQGAHRWGLALRGYGYGDAMDGGSAVAPQGAGNRVEYRRGALTEWYVNGPLGLEQGFTVARPPAKATDDPLTLTFALSGTLTASVDAGARSVTLSDDGVRALRYGGLSVVDADRRDLRAWLEVAGDRLRVRVDDAGARYPLTIDPYVQAAKLTTVKPCDLQGVCDDGSPYDNFGYSVSISADASTVVVGVPFKYTNSIATGALYVFVRPSDYEGGWNSIYPIFYKAKLLASDGATAGRRLGWSVDVSRDGGTIVAGAPGSGSHRGAAYVFVKPSFGWGTNLVQTQTARLVPDYTGFNQRPVGTSVAISGDGGTIAVGAPDDFGSDFGSAYVFDRFSGWVDTYETQRLTAPLYTLYGSSVALSDDGLTLAVGAMGENPAGGTGNFIGAAHVLARDPTYYFSEVAKLIPSDGVPWDLFGASISVAGNGSAIVVGAPVNAQDETLPHAGGAYVFVRPASGWTSPAVAVTQTAKLTAGFSWENDHLGRSVDISVDGNTIVAGAIEPPSLPGTTPGPGIAYLFARPPAGWTTTHENTQVRTQDGVSGDGFGAAAALSGDGHVTLVGAPHETLNANVFQGAAYVFTGSANDPVGSVSPSAVTFAPQAIGTTSNPRTVTLTNTGASPLHVSSVGTNGPFATTQHCVVASPIAPGSSCAESVTFTPQSIGEQNGLVIFTDDGAGPMPTIQFAQLQGTGTVAATTTTIPSVSANPVLAGQPMTVYFSVAPAAGGTLMPSGTVTVRASTGESCTNRVELGSCPLTFSNAINRTITATYNGDLNFDQSTSAGALVRVVDVRVSVSPASQTISGKKAAYTLTVAAVNGFAGAVSLACGGGAPNSTCALSPTSVTLAGSTATAKAALTLPAGAAKGTYVVTFTARFGGAVRSTTASLVVK